MASKKKLKVYSWQDWRSYDGGVGQVRACVAAPSKAAAARAVGEKDPRRLFNLGETGNEDSINKAMSEPGIVFWYPLNQIPKNREWHRDSPCSLCRAGHPTRVDGGVVFHIPTQSKGMIPVTKCRDAGD